MARPGARGPPDPAIPWQPAVLRHLAVVIDRRMRKVGQMPQFSRRKDVRTGCTSTGSPAKWGLGVRPAGSGTNATTAIERTLGRGPAPLTARRPRRGPAGRRRLGRRLSCPASTGVERRRLGPRPPGVHGADRPGVGCGWGRDGPARRPRRGPAGSRVRLGPRLCCLASTGADRAGVGDGWDHDSPAQRGTGDRANLDRRAWGRGAVQRSGASVRATPAGGPSWPRVELPA